MKLQGSGALRFARKPAPEYRLALIFGEDEGVVADTAAALVESWTREAPGNQISLDEDEVRREPGLLFDALEAQSLLGENTILKLRTRGEKITAILKEVIGLAEESPHRIAGQLIVLATALNTKSKLRSAFEASNATVALHVFADSESDITDRVATAMDTAGTGITQDALALFVSGLPGHRSLANAEIEKLSLYAHNLGRPVEPSDIRALCETNADEDSRVAISLALDGKLDAAQAELDRVIEAGLSPISLLRQFEMEAARMLAAHALRGTGAGENIGMKLKPPVWKSEWPAFEMRLRKWSVARLLRLMERLHDMEEAAKSPGGAGMADAATRELFLAFAKAAA